jgi:AraC-like DNA-binding protein
MQHVYKSREKVFGAGRPRPMDRNAKARLMTLARALMRRREKGKAYGPVTAKALAVLEALLWGFHNAKTGLCFPSLASLAERAGCARSTVQKALDALETLGLLSWVHRLVRRREHGPEGWRWRVLRTSNGYQLTDPREPARLSDTERRSGTTTQVFHSIKGGKEKSSEPLLPTLEAALEGLRVRIQAQAT